MKSREKCTSQEMNSRSMEFLRTLSPALDRYGLLAIVIGHDLHPPDRLFLNRMIQSTKKRIGDNSLFLQTYHGLM